MSASPTCTVAWYENYWFDDFSVAARVVSPPPGGPLVSDAAGIPWAQNTRTNDHNAVRPRHLPGDDPHHAACRTVTRCGYGT